jgi:Spy/CpxP family protein refolding chaperone
MKYNMIKIAGVFLLALLMGTAIHAQSNRLGNRGLDNLELSEAQSEQITQLRTDHYSTMKPLRAKMAEIKAKERPLLSEESVDLKAVDKTIDQQTDLMNQMRKLQIKHQVAVKDVLTDEQVMKLEQRQRYAARRGQARFGHGQGPGIGYGRGYARDDARGYGRDDGRGYGRGYARDDGRGYGKDDGRGYGRGYGRDDGRGYGRDDGRPGRSS